MSQTVQKLVFMANQIAIALGHQMPHRAVEATCDHIRHFWDPRMRRLIAEHLAAGGVGLEPVARAAIEHLASPPTVPETQATAFTGPGGEAMSDAG